MVSTSFTPIASLAGGALIGVSAVLLMAITGRIAGVSGIAVRLLPPYFDGEFFGRFAFIIGLTLAPVLWTVITGSAPAFTLEARGLTPIVGGLLVGFGSIWGNGCTSGHGVCGISRLSVRSLIATIVFMSAAIVTVFLVRRIG
ncbi:MAG: YeeE/YedE family protein [Rhizobiales bacterium]|nr:YeeE/YedE family protein [Hyphomicrobiales bacterium]